MFEKFYKQKNFSYKIFDENIIASATDLDGVIKYVSNAFCEITGYSKEELIGNKHNIIRHPDMPEGVYTNLWATITAGKTWKGVIKNKRKDGGYYWVKAVIEPYYGENKEKLGYVSVRTDITKIVDGISKLNDYKKGLDESSYFLILDSNFKVKSINHKFLKILGYTLDELLSKEMFNSRLIGQNIFYGFMPDDIFKKSVFSHKIWSGTMNALSKSGEKILCDTTFIPVSVGENIVNEYLLILHDITDIETAKKELKKSNEQLKELDIKKSEFLNIASHDLRTPMTSIKGYLSMFLEGDFGDMPIEQREYIQEMYDNSNRMLDLINDMLDISKLENGKMEFICEEFDIVELARDILKELNPLIISKSQSIELFTNLDSIHVNLDKNRSRQFLINLLSNANKYTDIGGKIELVINKKDKVLTIEVKDNGFGISKENFGKIFEKFGKVITEKTKDITGTGLGLPIVKSIVTHMGGTISISSEVGKGSNFKIKFIF